MRYIKNITTEELSILKDRKKNAKSVTERNKAHSIILSSKKKSIKELIEIFDNSRSTIMRWLNGWDKDKVASLTPLPRKGRHTKLKEHLHKEKIAQWIKERPNKMVWLLSKIEEEFNIKITDDTARTFLKKTGLIV